MTSHSLSDEAAQWNGDRGQAWVETEKIVDGMFLQIEARIAAMARSSGARRVLDIGCGNGATTRAVAAALPEGGHCTGIDVSAPMIRNATEHARGNDRLTFICADAEVYPFTAGNFDLLVSRFGVMFFANPVAAFANLYRAAAPAAQMELIVWRSPEENDFMTTARRAVATHRPDLAAPPPPPDGPGPFGFSDPDRVRMILSGAGWAQIQLQPFTIDCAFPVEHLPLFVRRLAPAGVDFETVSPTDRDALLHRIEAAYTPFVKDGHVTFTAACWSICARAGKAKAAC